MGFKVIILLLILLFISTIYHQVRKKFEIKKYRPLGKVINVGDGNLHIYGKGKGTPTIIFTCGNGLGFSLGNYYTIFSKLAETNRVVVYDRFGYGWSSSTSNARTIEQINKELYQLLKKSNEKAPFLLVGHSLGAIEVVGFAKRYPELVAGVVTLDGTSPSFYRNKKELSIQNIMASSITRFLSFTGLLRILINLKSLNTTSKLLPEEIDKTTKMIAYNRIYSNEAIEEVQNLIKNGEEEGTLNDTPLLVLTADKLVMKQKQKKLYQDFENSQNDLLKLSSNSRQIIINDADHLFLIKKPNVVIKELQNFLNDISN